MWASSSAATTWKSLNRARIRTVIVLADGLGSGVKASILSTLTSKIISTMMAEGMRLEDCVETIAATLPVCSERGVAYSTFTIHAPGQQRARRDYPVRQPHGHPAPGRTQRRDALHRSSNIGGKTIYRSEIPLLENDVFIAMSDGVPHAGIGLKYNMGWKREEIIKFMETFWDVGFTAKTLTTILLDECNRLYDGKPGDDATVCTVRIRARAPMNLMIGPPSNRSDAKKMVALFLAKIGKHIVCGGSTSNMVADYLGKPLKPDLNFYDPEIPPTATLEGIDLVTEGVITINRVLEYAQNYLEDNRSYEQWSSRQDGASRIARLLFEEATDINFFVGRAINPAHQNPDLPINFNIKMQLVSELAECLKKMGKRIKVSYF